MKLQQKKYYKMSPIEIVKDLQKKHKGDEFTLQFLENEIKNAKDVSYFWLYKLISSYINIKDYQQ